MPPIKFLTELKATVLRADAEPRVGGLSTTLALGVPRARGPFIIDRVKDGAYP